MEFLSTLAKWTVLLALVGESGRVWSSKHDDAGLTEEDGRVFMKKLNEENAKQTNRVTLARWGYDNNLTDYNLQKQLKVQAENDVWYKKQWEKAMKYPWDKFKDPLLKRQFWSYSGLGTAALPKKKSNRLDDTISTMTDVYSSTKLVDWKDRESEDPETTVSLEPELTNYFVEDANDSCKMQYYWEGWYDSVGSKEKAHYEEYVKISNEEAKLNNFTTMADDWNADFEMDHGFERTIHRLYKQILPLYQQLHAYVRRRLAEHHNTGDHNVIDRTGSLPAHLLGDVWAQTWSNIYNLTVPYPSKTSLDVTPTMIAKKFTPLKMFKMAEEFYTSINMSAMTDTFWKKSVLEKPTDREIVCHASSWDFSDGEDFRTKMCTRVDMEDFKTIHHEMGHIQYYMAYSHQPIAFRGGADSGFHEAVGDTMSLSVSTAEHLLKVGLLDPETFDVNDEESDINGLFLTSLDKVAFPPFGYILDLWRWDIFRGKASLEEYNCRFWQLRQDISGIVPPVDRSTEDFDGGAKYHVIADVPYIRYFVSYILQFQFYKALCIAAGQYNPEDPAARPLHHCDIYQKKEAGDAFLKMLRLGSSKPPKEALKVLTGQEDMDAGPLLEYFKPLHDWLIRENRRTGEKIGWFNGKKIQCGKNGEVKTIPGIENKDPKCHYSKKKSS